MKRILCVVLCVALCACVFAGCGSKTESTSAENSDKAESTEAAAKSAEYNWDNMNHTFFCQGRQSTPYYVLLPDGCRPYDCCTGAATTKLTDNDIVLTVNSGDKEMSADFSEDPYKATKPEEIVPAFTYSFDKVVQSSNAFLPYTADKQPHFEVNSSESVSVNAVKATYEACKSEGTYYYMAKADDNAETAIYFVSYATFLSDGTPFYCAVFDVSADQSEKQACNDYCLEMIQGLCEVTEDFFTQGAN